MEERAEIAAAVLDLALGKGAALAEVYLKTSSSCRCELDKDQAPNLQFREECGIALRVWDGGGREGFAHSDGGTGIPPDGLIRRAFEAASRHPGGALPRLPAARRDTPGLSRRGASSGPGPSAEAFLPPWGSAGRPLMGRAAEMTATLARDLWTAGSGEGRRGVVFLDGWVEWGETRTWILNSLGLQVTFPVRLATAGVEVAGRRPQARNTPLRYITCTESLDEIDPASLVGEASWRAAAGLGGEPASAPSCPVLLAPWAAAAWVRSLAPHFLRGRASSGGGHGASLDSIPLVPRAGFDLFDDPTDLRRPPWRLPPVPFDGEGRRAVRRTLLADGLPRDRCADSRDPSAEDGELGPMRRDSYRDLPEPGPLSLRVSAGSKSREEILRDLTRGLFVCALTPWSRPGAGSLTAEVSGVWIERGRARRAVAGCLMVLPEIGSLARLAARGTDLELVPGAPPVETPSLLIEGAKLAPL